MAGTYIASVPASSLDHFYKQRLLSITSKYLEHGGALNPATNLELHEELEEPHRLAAAQYEKAVEVRTYRVMHGEYSMT